MLITTLTLLIFAVSAASASAGPTVIDSCTCFENGNYYSPTTDCRGFTQRTAFLPEKMQACGLGTLFNVDRCTCDHPGNVDCPKECPGTYEAPATSDRTCYENGNIYAVVLGSYCSRFTQATVDLPPQEHRCPGMLIFDIDRCVCNYPNDVDTSLCDGLNDFSEGGKNH